MHLMMLRSYHKVKYVNYIKDDVKYDENQHGEGESLKIITNTCIPLVTQFPFQIPTKCEALVPTK